MAPSFAELKAKAAKAKDASVAKIQNTRDRNTSIPLKKTNWDPYSGQPAPPPPPPRVNSTSRPQPVFPPPPPPPNRPVVALPPSRTPSLPSRSLQQYPSPVPSTPAPAPRPPRQIPSASSSSGPPPIKLSTRPDQPSRLDEALEPTINWADLSAQDKEAFFGWLDEFFSRCLNIEIMPRVFLQAQ